MPKLRRLKSSQVFHVSEVELVNKLQDEGIYAIPGTRSHFAYVDIVAWGCIGVESKYSSGDRFGYSFHLQSGRIKTNSFRGDIVVLACEQTNGTPDYYVFDANDPVFYINGRLKKGIKWTPHAKPRNDHRFGLCLTDDLMVKHKDAWHLIEEKRLQISRDIRTGTERVVKLPLKVA